MRALTLEEVSFADLCEGVNFVFMDQVITELGGNGITLPLFIKPKNGQDSAEFLIQWIGDNKELLKQKILEYGVY